MWTDAEQQNGAAMESLGMVDELISRREFDQHAERWKAEQEKLANQVEALREEVQRVRRQQASVENRTEGVSHSWAVVLAVATFLSLCVAVITSVLVVSRAAGS